MANREKGHISIDIGGRAYCMALTLDAMVALEELFSTPDKPVTFQEVMERSDAGSMTHTRALIWATLQANDPQPSLSEISGLVEEAGGFGTFTVALLKVAKAVVPDPKDLDALGIRAPNPPAAQVGRRSKAGTGVNSTSTPGASV
jgi:hypothetical protein